MRIKLIFKWSVDVNVNCQLFSNLRQKIKLLVVKHQSVKLSINNG